MEIENPKKTYRNTRALVYSCQYHVIFCTKYRRSVLQNGIAERLRQLVGERQKDLEYKILEMDIQPDHVHLLLDTNPKTGIYRTVNQIKGYSSKILREEFPELKSRLPTLWTRSKFISTVGSVSLDVVKRYIEDQKGV